MKKSLFLLLLFTGCSFADKTRSDFTPPELTKLLMSSPDRLEITFSEPILPDSLKINVQEGFMVTACDETDSAYLFTVIPALTPGQSIAVNGLAKDASGNTLNFLRTLYGPNPRIPKALINELIIQGSSTHPDCLELKFQEPGNTGGMTLYFGSPDTWAFRYIFPAIEVETGDYLIFHCKPSFGANEITEISAKDLSGGLDSHSHAWDAWPSEVWALNGNNGLVTLASSPGGSSLDCFLYSIRTRDSDENFGGFGSKDLWDGVQWLKESGSWLFKEDRIYPEDAFNPTGTTSTRTINRSSVGTDTNNPADWHITPTKGATIGYANNDTVYSP